MPTLSSSELSQASGLIRGGVKVLLCVVCAFTLTACDENIYNRQDRRDDRQDCRAAEGLIGGDKRDCKQENRSEPAQPAAAPAPAAY